ncbi:glycosyl transferase family 2 [Thalassoporum mexicanum PCC 7367]|uniref:glycosyltransferase family 2 protein n=1 Tax=Thalassoporum mexicanum TaxID=3457544 RepID=UPI00029FB089|nr:glycosyltransferase family A protein [Pseudanabaena sp. PCC 7367]AFY71118.1 glycosyl transferase family 2 [Pseudanabaena sp. PCC 7367]
MLFSVVIPTCHRNDLLANCLDRLAPGSQTTSASYEVIVSDDGSDSTAEAMMKEYYAWAKWVAGPRQGPAANRNNGASYAQGDWLVFTDDDCIPELNWLEAYANAIVANPESQAFEGAIHPLGDTEIDMANCPVNLAGGNFWSANIAVKTKTFQQINGFDPSYPLAAYEDQDLYLRLSDLTAIPFISPSIVVHPVRITPLSYALSLNRIVQRSASYAYHVNKHSKVLGYESNLKFMLMYCKYRANRVIYGLRERKAKRFLVAIFLMLVNTPLTLYYLFKFNDHRRGRN